MADLESVDNASNAAFSQSDAATDNEQPEAHAYPLAAKMPKAELNLSLEGR